MEKPSEGTSDTLEDAPRCGGGPQSRMDEYISVPGGDEADLGPEKHDIEGHAGGAGGRPIDTPGEGREGRGVQMGGDTPGCKLLAREGGSYPCWDCPGGLSFSECQRLRGDLK